MWALGEFAQISDALELALRQQVEWVGNHDIYALLADAAARQNQRQALQKYAPLAEENANRYAHRLYQGVSQRAWGVLHRLSAELDQAQTRLLASLEIFQELGCRWQSGRTMVELGRLAQAQADADRARSWFEQALALFDEMSAQGDAALVRDLLASPAQGNSAGQP